MSNLTLIQMFPWSLGTENPWSTKNILTGCHWGAWSNRYSKACTQTGFWKEKTGSIYKLSSVFKESL